MPGEGADAGGRGGRDRVGAALAVGDVEHGRDIVVDARCEHLCVDGDHEPAVALQRELRRGATVRFRHIDCGGRAGRPDGDREHPVRRLRGVFGQPILIERGVSSSMRPP